MRCPYCGSEQDHVVDSRPTQEGKDAIEHEIQNRMEAEISSVEIGRMVMQKLLEIDPVAYVRFASVYEEFQDPQQFNRVVQMLTRMQKARQRKGF
jgi:transcriptional regulator NrdR family protein